MSSECEQLEARVSAYLDQELGGEESAQVEAHLESCGRCRRLLEDFRALNAAASAKVPEVAEEEWRKGWQAVFAAIQTSEPGGAPDTCQQAQEQIGALLDGQLSAEQAAAVDKHLESCVRCREAMARLRALDAVASGGKVPPVSQQEWDARWQRISHAGPGTSARYPVPDTRRRSATQAVPGSRLRLVRRAIRPVRIFWVTAAAAAVFLVFWAAHLMAPKEEPPRQLAWKTQREFSVQAIDSRGSDVTPICYYSEEADLTIVWLATD